MKEASGVGIEQQYPPGGCRQGRQRTVGECEHGHAALLQGLNGLDNRAGVGGLADHDQEIAPIEVVEAVRAAAPRIQGQPGVAAQPVAGVLQVVGDAKAGAKPQKGHRPGGQDRLGRRAYGFGRLVFNRTHMCDLGLNQLAD